jgi:hypothetical protein
VSFPLKGGIERARVLVLGTKGWADAASQPVLLGAGATPQ